MAITRELLPSQRGSMRIRSSFRPASIEPLFTHTVMECKWRTSRTCWHDPSRRRWRARMSPRCDESEKARLQMLYSCSQTFVFLTLDFVLLDHRRECTLTAAVARLNRAASITRSGGSNCFLSRQTIHSLNHSTSGPNLLFSAPRQHSLCSARGSWLCLAISWDYSRGSKGYFTSVFEKRDSRTVR